MSVNPRIPDQLERLATDIRVDRHGDPHLAFVILLYPDQPGTVLCVGLEGRPPCDMTLCRFRTPGGSSHAGDKVGTVISDLDEARHTLGDLYTGLRVARPDRGGTLTEQVRKWMADARSMRLLHAVRRHLERADYEQKYPARCEFCSRRLTTKGVTRHERVCYKNPAAPLYGKGGYEPVRDDARQIVGYRERQGRERDN